MVQLNPAFLNSNPFPLDLPCFSQSFTIGYLELSYLELSYLELSYLKLSYLKLSYLKLPISNKEQHPLFLFYRQIYPTISNSQLYEQIVASLESSRLAGFCTVQLLVFV